ncbi:MAG: alanine--tRNA ligase-related protein, partial [Oscillospiraceae bacterium]
FNKTIDRGMKILDDYIAEMKAKGEKVLDGEACFKLSDTYGFPIDLTREILEENGLEADEEGFEKAMETQREMARKARGGSKYMGADETVFHQISRDFHTEFVGYDTLECDSEISFIATDDQLIENAGCGEEVYIVSSRTPFYAESGGQVADIGEIVTESGKCQVIDVQKAVAGKFAHKVKVTEGAISVGQAAHFKVDKIYRNNVMRNHSCAHLLQAALRKVLGEHVHQAGQLVSDDRLRFDFSHFEAMTEEEKLKVQRLVNDYIFDALPIKTKVLPIEEAKKLGAMALFGEKYGDTVRVVDMSDDEVQASMEFCGGTHVKNTSEIGLFYILSENSVASGVRRIEAVTGTGVLKFLRKAMDNARKAAEILKIANPMELAEKCVNVVDEIKQLEKEKDALQSEISSLKTKSLFENPTIINGVKVVSAMLTNMKTDMLRKIGDMVKSKESDCVAVIAGVNGEKANILVVAGKDAVAKGAHAGKIVKEVAAITGGKGGGRPDSAMAGVGDRFKIDEALDKVNEIVGSFI